MPRPARFVAVTQRLREHVRSAALRPGEPLPSEKELARELQVSRVTLRKALSILADEQLVVRRHGCGTFVNFPGADRKAGAILYIGNTQDHFYQTFYSALCVLAGAGGFGVTSCAPAPGGDYLADIGHLAATHGRIIVSDAYWDMVRNVVPRDARITYVSGFDGIETLPADARAGYCVSTDTYRGAKLAVEHLCSLGHQRIAYVDVGFGSGEDPLLGSVAPRRAAYLGYRAGLIERGLSGPYVLGARDFPGNEWQQHQFDAARRYLDQPGPLPTAFVCVGDFRAGPLIRALRARGLRVPEDASVMGIGNTPWAQWLDPPLTSVCLGEAQMARLALLLSEAPPPDRPEIIRVDPELVVRQSTAAAVDGRLL